MIMAARSINLRQGQLNGVIGAKSRDGNANLGEPASLNLASLPVQEDPADVEKGIG